MLRRNVSHIIHPPRELNTKDSGESFRLRGSIHPDEVVLPPQLPTAPLVRGAPQDTKQDIDCVIAQVGVNDKWLTPLFS